MKLLSILALFIISLSLAFSEEVKTLSLQEVEELPTDIQREVLNALQQAEQARKAYLEAIARANERAVQRLERQVTNHTRRGNLDEALKAREVIEVINAGWVKEEVEREYDLLGNEIKSESERIESKLVGVWVNRRNVHTYNDDGTCTSSSGRSGTWIVSEDGSFEVDWGDRIYTITFIDDNTIAQDGHTEFKRK